MSNPTITAAAISPPMRGQLGGAGAGGTGAGGAGAGGSGAGGVGGGAGGAIITGGGGAITGVTTTKLPLTPSTVTL